MILFPFQKNEFVEITVTDRIQKKFKFQPGFEYEILQHKTRLKDISEALNEDFDQWYNDKAPEIGQLVYTPSDIIKTSDIIWRQIEFVKAKLKPPYRNYDTNLVLDLDSLDEQDIFGVVWFKDGKWTNYEGLRTYNTIAEGNYEVLFFREDSTYFQKKIVIKPNVSHFKKYTPSNTLIQKDKDLVLLKSIFNGSFTANENFPIALSTDSVLGDSVKVWATQARFKGIVNIRYGDSIVGEMLFKKVGTPEVLFKKTIPEKGYCSFIIAPGIYDIEVVTAYGNFEKLESMVFLPFDEISTLIYRTDKNTESEAISVFPEQPDETRRRFLFKEKIFYSIGFSDKESAIMTPRYFFGGEGSVSNSSYEYNTNGSINTGNNSSFDIDTLIDDFAEQQLTTSYDIFPKDDIPDKIRTNFKDVAYWQPNLITDQNGETFFNVTFPENITSWNTLAIGMDDKLRSGFTQINTKAFKPVMAQLVIPRFLIAGDKAQITGKSINYTLDSFNITTQFEENTQPLPSKEVFLKDAFIEKMIIQPSLPTDSFKVKYQLTMEDYLDGEVRNIPVLRKGITETNGHFYILEGDTAINISLGDSINGNIHLTAYPNIIDLMLEDISYLKDYPYDCNEQNASRLTALLLEKEIRTQLNQPFKNEREIVKTIRKLKKTQNEDGSWGWWNNGTANNWMTTYVLKALHKAEQNGYSVSNEKQKATTFIANNYKNSTENKFRFLAHNSLLADLNIKARTYETELASLDTTQLNLYYQMLYIKALQFYNLPYSLNAINQYIKRTTTGGLYFGEYNTDWNSNSIQLSLLANEIYKKAGCEAICKGIRQYLIERRQHDGWRNTFESAQILNLLLPYALENGSPLAPSTLSIDNQPIKWDNTPVQTTMQTVPKTISKTGALPVYLSIYQEYHNENPINKKDIFEINTSFHQSGKIDNANPTLQKNERITLKAIVKVKESAEYVMIEVPIPAGCSYSEKPQNGDFEVHREYFKHKVSIFCQHLPIGTYEFEIPLATRFSGTFTVNTAKVEQIYFPIFYGRNENKIVQIK